MHSPHSVAREPHGDEWIADTGNDRLLHLNADGSFAGIVGGFPGPQDVAIDAAGVMYVADTGNGQIVVDTPPAPRLPLLGLLLPAGRDTVTTIGGFQRPVGVATFAKTLYVRRSRSDLVGAAAAQADVVVAGAAGDLVGAWSALEEVVAGAAVDDVRGAPAVDKLPEFRGDSLRRQPAEYARTSPPEDGSW